MGCEGILLGEGRAGALECSTRDGKGAGARGGSELTDLPLGPKSSGPGRAGDGVPGPRVIGRCVFLFSGLGRF